MSQLDPELTINKLLSPLLLVQELAKVSDHATRYQRAIILGQSLYEKGYKVQALAAYAVARATRSFDPTLPYDFDFNAAYNEIIFDIAQNGLNAVKVSSEDRKLLQELAVNNVSSVKKMLEK